MEIQAVTQAAELARASLSSLGFAEDLAAKLETGVKSGALSHLHSVVVARRGKVALERYFSGIDETGDGSREWVDFTADTLHDVRSLTKSVVGLLYGIALDRGLVPGLDEPLLAHFPAYGDLASDAQRTRILVRHALTMTLGLEWDETKPYPDPGNFVRRMELAEDPDRFVLDRPVLSAPGIRWTYCGGAVALLGALIARGAGTNLANFARDYLFGPIGVTDFDWTPGNYERFSPGNGLRLRSCDLIRLGMLVLARGAWNGRQVVPRDWLDQSAVPVTRTSGSLGFGRLWYVGEAPPPALSGPQRWIGAFGNGGQCLWIMPSAELVVAIFSGNYGSSDAWVTPIHVWRQIVVANLVRV